MIGYILVFSVLLCKWICLSCVLRVCELSGETIHNVFGYGYGFAAESYGWV